MECWTEADQKDSKEYRCFYLTEQIWCGIYNEVQLQATVNHRSVTGMLT